MKKEGHIVMKAISIHRSVPTPSVRPSVFDLVSEP